jgi:hypothetical protein
MNEIQLKIKFKVISKRAFPENKLYLRFFKTWWGKNFFFAGQIRPMASPDIVSVSKVKSKIIESSCFTLNAKRFHSYFITIPQRI